jgi:hypothetical protein
LTIESYVIKLAPILSPRRVATPIGGDLSSPRRFLE